MKTYVYKKAYTRVFIVALFVITPILEPPKCTTGECINRLCQIHTIEFCSTVKKNELPVCPPAWINVRNIESNERTRAWKSTFLCDSTYLNSQKSPVVMQSRVVWLPVGGEVQGLLKGAGGNFSCLLHMFCVLWAWWLPCGKGYLVTLFDGLNHLSISSHISSISSDL